MTVFASRSTSGKWLPDMDLNHDKQIQSLLCYRYTIGQTNAFKVGSRAIESRLRNAKWSNGGLEGWSAGRTFSEHTWEVEPCNRLVHLSTNPGV